MGKKKVLSPGAVHMARLYKLYAKVIRKSCFDIGYTWSVQYIVLADGISQDTEFTCITANIVFAAMIFEASQLPAMIEIQRLEILGFA